MDVFILAAGIGSRLVKFTHDIIPKYLVNIDNNTGLYYIINYWSKYANNIYLVINSKYNIITTFYINNILIDHLSKIKIINYDTNDGTAYTINHILNNELRNVKIDNLLITWCDLYPIENIDFKKIPESNKNNNIFVFTHGDKCRYKLNKNSIIKEENGNIIGIYYFQNFKHFVLGDYCKNNDIVDYLEMVGTINQFEINNIIDYGDEDKLMKYLNNKTDNLLKCRYFNNIDIIDDNKLLKKGINDKGKEIIKFEKNWYKYISELNNNDINKYIPKIYNLFEFAILMEYKKNYIPVYIFLSNCDKNDNESIQTSINNANYNIIKITVLKNIINKVKILHSLKKKTESKAFFFSNLKKEIYDKIFERTKIIKDFLNYFGDIKIVNGIYIKSFDEIIEKCKQIITTYYDTLDLYEYSIIFGDCQFSNILINPNDISDIIFIDPRGYFGDSNIYGPVEYDFAKILYAISGYDSFNSKHFNIKKIDTNLQSLEFEIKGFYYDKNIINKYFNKIHKTYLVIIWLSLAEYNKNNIWKCLASYYYGLYLGTIL